MVQFHVLVIISPLSSNFTLPELRLYLGISHGVTFDLIPNCTESSYRQISIETATYSYYTYQQYVASIADSDHFFDGLFCRLNNMVDDQNMFICNFCRKCPPGEPSTFRN